MIPQSHLILPLPFPSSLSFPTTPELSASVMVSSPSSAQHQQFAPNPNKKKRSRTLMISVDDSEKPRPRKTDPNAPKITRPCTECGKRFWSWKALFGHMRCHPERQWRGINPPPNLRSPSPRPTPAAGAVLMETKTFHRVWAVMTEEDHEVAECLLKLADGPFPLVNRGEGGVVVVKQKTNSHEDRLEVPTACQQFECSSCKKVFGSHQALGGHRASHKNVKGCFAMMRSVGGSEEVFLGMEGSLEGAATISIGGGHHQCGICNQVFPSGQAFGGHKRCHWEKGEEEEEEEGGGGGQFFCLDLNQPAAPLTIADDDSSSSHASDLTLDLRLGL